MRFDLWGSITYGQNLDMKGFSAAAIAPSTPSATAVHAFGYGHD
jgi:hypothetical protein